MLRRVINMVWLIRCIMNERSTESEIEKQLKFTAFSLRTNEKMTKKLKETYKCSRKLSIPKITGKEY